MAEAVFEPDTILYRSDGLISTSLPWPSPTSPTAPWPISGRETYPKQVTLAVIAPMAEVQNAEAENLDYRVREIARIANGQRAYAVRYLAIWNVLILIAMTWSVLTGMALASSGYWLNPWSGIFGCVVLAWVGFSLLIAGNGRRG